MEEREINKILKPSKTLLIWTIAFAVIAAALYGIAFYLDSGLGKEAKNLHELIYNYEDKEGEYAEINIAYLPYQFAIEDETLKYYFVMDDQDYMYIARLTDETFSEIEKLDNETEDKFSYTLKGYIFDIPSELKSLAIESYNEVFEEEVFTYSNFEEYVGSVYIDETLTPESDTYSALIAFAGLAIMVTVIMFIIYILYIIKVMRVDKSKIEIAKEELAGSNVKPYNKQKLYLTENYVISNYNGLHILEYKEILWLYNLIQYYRGVATGKSLMAFTSNKKKIAIGHTSNVSNQTIEEIMGRVQEKNPSLRIGYTDENIDYFKKYKKEN